MNLSPTRLRLIRSVGLLLMLAVSVAGFMLLIDLLADTASGSSDDLLAEADSDEVLISLPSSASLFALGVAAVALIVALGVIAAPSNWRRSGVGLPRPSWRPLGIAAAIALIVAAAGLFLAFSDSSPLFQQQAETAAGAAGQGAAGHQVDTEWLAPIGVVILATFFFTVILIGFLRPRLILPVLALWLAASMFFGFFDSSAIAGLRLFNPVITLPASDAFAVEVARHRTTDLSPDSQDVGNVAPGTDDGPQSPGDGDTAGMLGGEYGQDAPGEITEEAVIARLRYARDPADRASAADQLPGFGSDDALRALAHAWLNDPSPVVRERAIDAVTEWDFETLVEILQEHPERVVRQAAAAALGRLNDQRAVEPLATALLTDESPDVRQESAKALSRLRGSDGVSALIQSLQRDAADDVRGESARALGILGDERAVHGLLEALEQDLSGSVRENSAKSLGTLRSSGALAELDAARAGDHSADVRFAAGGALDRYTYTELIEALGSAVDPDDRATAARILGERRIRPAIPTLMEALFDGSPVVREAALDALDQFGSLHQLENGGVLLSHQGGVTLNRGTITSQQADGQPQFPLFVVEGAANTDFLRMAVGDRYAGQRWYLSSETIEPYRIGTTVSHQYAPIHQLDSMPRDDVTVRQLPNDDDDVADFVGFVPAGYALETVSVNASYFAESATLWLGRTPIEYSFTIRVPRFDAATLQAATPAEYAEVTLPDSVPDRVRQLAKDITAGYSGAYAKAKAIEQYLRHNYTYKFADSSTPPIPAGSDPVDWFLFESGEGTCGNFSSAFVVLAQSIGLPARVVSGYSITPTEQEQIVFADQAHQRAEIAFEGLGWVPFEPTAPDGSAPDRAQGYFESGAASVQGEQDELQELAAQLSSQDADAAQAARAELEARGADVIPLENGGSVVKRGDHTIATPPRTTTQHAPSPPAVGVFTVTGAKRTEYLLTATGDVYENGQWQQLDPVLLDYSPRDTIPERVLSAIKRGGEPWDAFPKARVDSYLLAPDYEDYDAANMERVRIAPLTPQGRIPAGVIPVSRHLSVMERDGVYSPFSGVFTMSEAALGYQWWSVVPRLPRETLRYAEVIDDPTYTELPFGVPYRIRELAMEITAGWVTPYEKAKAIENHLRRQYSYQFADDSTAPPRPADHDPVDWFLFESREGTSGQFSSAFVVLARSIGLPARVASGWVINPSKQSQVVQTNQAHQWAEVAFERIGWVAFEPTAEGNARTRVGLPAPSGNGPSGTGSADIGSSGNGGSGGGSSGGGGSGNSGGGSGAQAEPGPRIYATVTDITDWPPVVVRGEPFTIGGTVETQGGRPVSGMQVEIFVNEIKANGGLRVGSGTVTNGRYTIEVEIPSPIERGKYQLIAHAIGHAIGAETYLESWSDPDIAVFAKSGLVLSGPQEVDVGTEAVFRGRVTEDNGDAVAGLPVSIVIDGRRLPRETTDSDGSFSFTNTFLSPGRHWAEARFSDTDFLRGNSVRLNLDVVMPTTLTLDVPAQTRVDEPFTITGKLLDIRESPLPGHEVVLRVGDNEEIEVFAGVDGTFSHEVTLPAAGQFAVTADYGGEHPILPATAAASVIARDVTVVSFEGPREILSGESATFAGTVTSPTASEDAAVSVEIVDGAGDVLQTVDTTIGGALSFETGALTETGPHTLTARVSEQGFLTSGAATVAYSVVHPTMITVDGPPIAMVGQHIEFVGTLTQADGQPVPNASVLLGGDPVITAEDGTFSRVITMPESLGEAAIEDRIGIAYEFEGTDRLASASGSRSIIVGVPRLTTELVSPVARGAVAEVRGAAFTGTRPLPNAAVTLTGGHAGATGSSGQFLFEYQVGSSTPIGPLRLTAELDQFDIQATVELDIRSSTHVVAVPLEDVRPGRVVEAQVALYDDTGAGIPGARLQTSTGLSLVTDEFGQALFELTVPENEALLTIPITFTYNGDTRHMPLNYFLGIPVTQPSFNWLLWVVLPAFLLIVGAGGFGAYRLRAAGVPLDVRRLTGSGALAAVEPAPPPVDDDGEPLPAPLETSLELTLGGPGADTGNVYGLSEEVIISGRLMSGDGSPVQNQAIELREPLGDVAMIDTDESGEFRLVLRADERGEFSVAAQFAGDESHLESAASASYRIVDFREEMVRLFGDFMEWAAHLDVGIAGQSPRETESILVAAGVPVDQRALDEFVTRFEEADYSEHEIARRHYEAMYRAWRTVTGERA